MRRDLCVVFYSNLFISASFDPTHPASAGDRRHIHYLGQPTSFISVLAWKSKAGRTSKCLLANDGQLILTSTIILVIGKCLFLCCVLRLKNTKNNTITNMC